MSGYPISITQQQLFAVLQPFVATVTGLPSDCVIQGLGNRLSLPPATPGFVALTATRSGRLRWNIECWDTTSEEDPTTETLEQGTELCVQIDCYGPSAPDWAVALSTVLRDGVGVSALAPLCAPLYTNDPIEAPLEDSEDQYEFRFIVECYLQYNPQVTVSQDFFDSATVTTVNVDQAYPP